MTAGDEAPLADAATVLLLAPDVRDATVGACARLLENGEETPDRVVPVTFSGSQSGWVDAWVSHDGPPEARVTGVDVETTTRSAAASPGGGTDAGPGELPGAGPSATPVASVENPADLMALGSALTDVLSEADAAGQRVAITLHSLTALLEYVSRETAFKFLFALGDRVDRSDAVVYAHLDANAHDEETVRVFSEVCDAVVELNGDMTVRST